MLAKNDDAVCLIHRGARFAGKLRSHGDGFGSKLRSKNQTQKKSCKATFSRALQLYNYYI